jgi:hypothetical protein
MRFFFALQELCQKEFSGKTPHAIMKLKQENGNARGNLSQRGRYQ